MRGFRWVAALALVTLTSCAATVSGGKAATGGSRPGQWILVESPPKGELSEATFPPIYTWKRVRTFGDAESCSNFRVDMMWDAQSMASRAMLEQVSNLHCVPAAKLATPATGPKSPGAR
jgi:hypothetical protein